MLDSFLLPYLSFDVIHMHGGFKFGSARELQISRLLESFRYAGAERVRVWRLSLSTGDRERACPLGHIRKPLVPYSRSSAISFGGNPNHLACECFGSLCYRLDSPG